MFHHQKNESSKIHQSSSPLLLLDFLPIGVGGLSFCYENLQYISTYIKKGSLRQRIKLY